MRIRTANIAVFALVGWASLLTAQASGRIETRTRLVAQFSGLQTQWMEAIEKKDPAALDRLLSDDFEVWTPTHDGPIPREEWQPQAFTENLKSFRLANMAVKSPRDGVAIQSFRLETTTLSKGSDVMQEFFVVNLWTSEKDTWRCTDSYMSPIQAHPKAPPVKPTGKN